MSLLLFAMAYYDYELKRSLSEYEEYLDRQNAVIRSNARQKVEAKIEECIKRGDSLCLE